MGADVGVEVGVADDDDGDDEGDDGDFCSVSARRSASLRMAVSSWKKGKTV